MAYRGTVWRLGSNQQVAATTSATQTTNAFGAGTHIVRVSSTVGARIAIAKDPTAVSTGPYIKAGEPEYLVCNPGEKLSAIRVATSGVVTVTECS